jgi:hypothetical protein
MRRTTFALLCLLCLPLWAHSQCANCKKVSYSMVFKADATAMFREEYRFTLERTFWDRVNLAFYIGGGTYRHTNTLSDGVRLQNADDFSTAFSATFEAQRSPFRYNTLGFLAQDSAVVREEASGGILRFGLREYLTHISPYGLFVQLGGSFTNIGSDYYTADGSRAGAAITQALGGGLALGYQFLFGGSGQFAIDIYGGLDYVHMTRHYRANGNAQQQNAPFMMAHSGIQLGYAIHK